MGQNNYPITLKQRDALMKAAVDYRDVLLKRIRGTDVEGALALGEGESEDKARHKANLLTFWAYDLMYVGLRKQPGVVSGLVSRHNWHTCLRNALGIDGMTKLSWGLATGPENDALSQALEHLLRDLNYRGLAITEEPAPTKKKK